jgi:hypothetical protein
MKLTSPFILAIAVLLTTACGESHEAVADTTEAAAETFTTAPLIDPNSADADVIAAVPGIDADLAQQVIAGRPYATPSALHAVLKDAVDEDGLKAIYSAMFVTVDLNTGDNADYQLIPTSLSPRKLAHEFEEYRPYTSMEQFSREMSKYVSAEEVAYLRRYVTID